MEGYVAFEDCANQTTLTLSLTLLASTRRVDARDASGNAVMALIPAPQRGDWNTHGVVAPARPATGTQAHAPGRNRGCCAAALRGATPAADRAGPPSNSMTRQARTD